MNKADHKALRRYRHEINRWRRNAKRHVWPFYNSFSTLDGITRVNPRCLVEAGHIEPAIIPNPPPAVEVMDLIQACLSPYGRARLGIPGTVRPKLIIIDEA